MKYILNKKIKGFTLVEVMVAVSIFSIVVTIGMGALMSTIRANRKIQAKREITNGLALAMETMSRRLRLADPGSISVGTNFVTFWDPETTSWFTYQKTPGGQITVSNAGQVDITPTNFTVTDFSVTYDPATALKFLIIRLTGTMTIAGQTEKISLQTAVTPRSL
jgi:prepilin-type N-terminal cleavage/methylation domain-containing protein